MGGKASLLLILGFSSIMLIIGLNMNRVSTSAIDNSSSYFEMEKAKEIARSGMNLALSKVSRVTTWEPSSSPYSYMGSNNLEISLVRNGEKITIISTGNYENKSQTLEVKIMLPSFSEFAYFSNIEGNIWWTGDDSVWGPFHTNDQLQVQGHPYFAGPTTSHGGPLKYYHNQSSDAPTVIGEYTTGLVIDLPIDGISKLSVAASSGGIVFSGKSRVYLEFAGDSIKYKFNRYDNYITVLGTDLSPNGIIYVPDGDLYLQGIVKGKWSVGSSDDVFIEDDIVYNDIPDPFDENDLSTDLLGILAKDDVKISDNSNNNGDVNIHAAIYCEEGGFTAENYNHRGADGNINLIGGITQYQRGPVGTFSIYHGVKSLVSGFDKNYKYDSRLLRMVPPYFPSTKTFKVLSWLE